MNYKDLSQKLVAKCLKLGADAAEVYIETGRRLSMRLLNSEIDTIQESSSAGVGFRVIVDGRLGFSHSNDFRAVARRYNSTGSCIRQTYHPMSSTYFRPTR
jgi:PmbA protein